MKYILPACASVQHTDDAMLSTSVGPLMIPADDDTTESQMAVGPQMIPADDDTTESAS